MTKPNDYTGQRFGRLIALHFTGKYSKTSGGNKKRIWAFKCDCGTECEKLMEKVVRGWTRSCGCLKGRSDRVEVIKHAVFTDSYADGNLAEEEFLALSQRACFWCNEWRPNTRKHRYDKGVSWQYHGLDRLNSDLKHDSGNCVPCCVRCNTMKRDLSVDDFLTHIKKILDNRNNKI